MPGRTASFLLAVRHHRVIDALFVFALVILHFRSLRKGILLASNSTCSRSAAPKTWRTGECRRLGERS